MQLHAANIDGKLKQVPAKTAPNKVGGAESLNGNVKSSVANVNAMSFSGAPNGFGYTTGLVDSLVTMLSCSDLDSISLSGIGCFEFSIATPLNQQY